jgi:L-asparagine permease
MLAMLLPWPFYNGDESPFVTVFSRLGIGGIGDVMNAVVLTAALSSCNSGLYSTGRILRALADKGEAPKFVGKMNSRHVPYGGILFTSIAYVLGVVLNYIVPSEAFDIAIAIASLGVVATWATLIYSQMRMREAALRGELERPSYRMPGAPYTGWATLAFLVLVVVLMGFSDGAEKIAFYSIPVLVVVLVVGWRFVARRRPADAGLEV